VLAALLMTYLLLRGICALERHVSRSRVGHFLPVRPLGLTGGLLRIGLGMGSWPLVTTRNPGAFAPSNLARCGGWS